MKEKKENTADKCSKALNKVPDPEVRQPCLIYFFMQQHRLLFCLFRIDLQGYIFSELFLYSLPSNVYTYMLRYASHKWA